MTLFGSAEIVSFLSVALHKKATITLRSEFRYALLKGNRTKLDNEPLFCGENNLNRPECQRDRGVDRLQNSFVGVTDLILNLLFFPLSSICSFLLISVAILSLYSVHLLLMTAKEGGW